MSSGPLPHSNFRGGKAITIGAIVGSCLIAAACFSAAFTVGELTQENWISKTTLRALYTFLTLFGGLFAISVALLKPSKPLLACTAISILTAGAFTFFPSGLQLISGADRYTGRLDKIVYGSARTRMMSSPQSKTIGYDQTTPYSQIHMTLEDGTQVILTTNSHDLDRYIENHSLLTDSKLSEASYKIVILSQLDRVLSIDLNENAP